MNLIKTNLIQAQEYTREMNTTLAMLELYKNKVIDSMAVPSWLLSDSDSFTKSSQNTELEWHNFKYPYKQPDISAIDIDVTKLP